MRKKLEGNGLWESSRMMLPEHKDRINRENRKKVKQTKPELTEEEMQEMFGTLQASKANTLEVTLTVFYEYENKKITGVVTGLDPRLYLIKIQSGYSWELIDFADVIGVQLDDGGY